ncbi:hypothetical protein METBIDRAFT_92656 [Metschnikowia bicuspidata var. bicuspidata NRRL YB-4993]|uniref:Uncharacterized protein n=1 Tax=Metschnikowia bicuspidata var. bicuspidata NRRL YB-4993 TaxID=869754 RepID=A0A1A0HF76_9ASCO|nr:hypothetical protein METBIDRAFT_92656 [Metschnikowia bicuspidata var. bicuspidata NRRL YB-4993]OBA22789.1 hypothetical protein METBIDRAFT_92656 [Metschnikowia bicuspidata var. bicuspidata NRRL YB-4993]
MTVYINPINDMFLVEGKKQEITLGEKKRLLLRNSFSLPRERRLRGGYRVTCSNCGLSTAYSQSIACPCWESMDSWVIGFLTTHQDGKKPIFRIWHDQLSRDWPSKWSNEKATSSCSSRLGPGPSLKTGVLLITLTGGFLQKWTCIPRSSTSLKCIGCESFSPHIRVVFFVGPVHLDLFSKTHCCRYPARLLHV